MIIKIAYLILDVIEVLAWITGMAAIIYLMFLGLTEVPGGMILSLIAFIYLCVGIGIGWGWVDERLNK